MEDYPKNSSDAGPVPTDESETTTNASSTGDQLVDELGRLGRKFVQVVETAWNSDQRRQIQEELRTGLNSVAESLESGIHEVSEKEQTKEVIGKAGDVADDVVEKVRGNEFANELASGLTMGLHTLGDQLDKIANDIRTSRHASTEDDGAASAASRESQDIPITDEDTDTV